MVTAEEIGAVALFAGARRRPSASGSRGRPPTSALVPGEYAAHEGGERALFAVLEGRIEAVKLVDGIERVVGERQPGRHLRRGADRARDGVPGRLPRGRAVARHADRAARLPRRRGRRRPSVARGGRQARGAPDGRRARPAGHRGRAAAAARDRRRASLGRGVHGAAALPRPQPDHVHVAHARRRRTPAEQWGGPLPADGGLPGDPRRRRQDRGAAAAPRGWPSCSASAPSRPRRSTTR